MLKSCHFEGSGYPSQFLLHIVLICYATHTTGKELRIFLTSSFQNIDKMYVMSLMTDWCGLGVPGLMVHTLIINIPRSNLMVIIVGEMWCG